MNKKAITLIFVIAVLASLQLACSFTDLISQVGGELSGADPQSNLGDGARPSGEIQDHTESEGAPPHSPAAGSSCTKAFAGSTNIAEGEEYLAGDSIEVIFNLTNTGTCTWDANFSLVQIGGDFTPISSSLSLPGKVGPGDSVELIAQYTAPSQIGPYRGVWKMQDADGGVFGQNDPPNSPILVAIRSIPSTNPQASPTPNPTQGPQPTQQPQTTPDPDVAMRMNDVTMLDGECYDFNHGHVIDCSDSKADFKYEYHFAVGGRLYKANDNEFGEGQDQEPDKSDCENANYAPIPQTIQEGKYKPFKIQTLASTTYGWIYIDNLDENGLTFDFLMYNPDPPTTAINPNPFVETQGDQLTVLTGECFDVLDGDMHPSCSGTFAGFLFEEVTKKSLQVMQISANELEFASVLNSEPNKSDCSNASYNTSPIWPIQETSYYCYQFVASGDTYFGWLRPTSFNSNGMTFDFLTWESIP